MNQTMPLPQTMTAMLLDEPRRPLRKAEIPVPKPGPGEILIRVSACGVCRTDLHIFDGELDRPKLPLVLGHEIVGKVVASGSNGNKNMLGRRVGVPWLGRTCGKCRYCLEGRENLCDNALFTGYTIDGGYAQYAVADARYSFGIPGGFDDIHACPLLCAGLIGYRSYRMIPDRAVNIGIYGFGAAAHIITQVAVFQAKKVYAFTKPGDEAAQAFARKCGATWAGGSDGKPPVELDAAIIFAPAGALVSAALSVSAKGAAIICGGIHMSDIPSFPYRYLWGERSVRSVANLTRGDGEDLLEIASKVPVITEVRPFPLDLAAEALESLRKGKETGAVVLMID
jgi:alcohol dehydrogenase, propanol-preferring